VENFNQILDKKKNEVESIIYRFIPEKEGKHELLIEAMEYSFKAGGKRLRPLIILESLKLFNGEITEAEPFLAAMEMIHTYSLVHDDLPAMDNDDFRRGKLTTHKKYGHAIGILAGDALLNYAYEIIANAIINSKNPKNAAKALKVLAEKAGITGMVGGQCVDVIKTGEEIDLSTLLFIYKLKTAALIEASFMIGAILSDKDELIVKDMERVGYLVGMAFQIQDDILDITSTTEILGKPVLSDEKNNKQTYATIYGLEKSKNDVLDYLNESVKILDKYSKEDEDDFLKKLVISLINREK